jgi:hypothetical protein
MNGESTKVLQYCTNEVVRIPPNLRFRVPRDYESMWSLGEDSWDLIHLRMAYGGVGHWPEMYQKVFQYVPVFKYDVM